MSIQSETEAEFENCLFYIGLKGNTKQKPKSTMGFFLCLLNWSLIYKTLTKLLKSYVTGNHRWAAKCRNTPKSKHPHLSQAYYGRIVSPGLLYVILIAKIIPRASSKGALNSQSDDSTYLDVGWSNVDMCCSLYLTLDQQVVFSVARITGVANLPP